MTDVDDRRAADPPVSPTVVDSDALDQHSDRLTVVQNLDLAGLLGIGQQYPAAEIGKHRTVFQCHELAEPLLDHHAAVQAQQRRPSQVDFQNVPLGIPQEVANRRESEQVLIPLRRLLGYCLGTLQFLVLHFQFDLMDLEFVE